MEFSVPEMGFIMGVGVTVGFEGSTTIAGKTFVGIVYMLSE